METSSFKMLVDIENSSLVPDTMGLDFDLSNNSTSGSAQGLRHHQYTESRVAMALLKYVCPIIIFVGCCGNILSVAVLLRPQMRRTSVYVYLASLACADTLVLLLSAFKTWIRLVSGFELLHVSNVGCKLFMFVFIVSWTVASWMVVAVSVDRLIVVLTPLEAATWCSPYRARLAALSLVALFSLLNAHLFWGITLQEESPGHYQCAARDNNVFMVEVFPWLRLVIYSLIPFTVVIFLNSIIIYRLVRDRRQLMRRCAANTASRSNLYRQSRLTAMLLCVTFVWLLLSAPFTIWRLVVPAGTLDEQTKAQVFLTRTICFMLLYLNHAINFGLYCLTGRKFRRELVNMFVHNKERTNLSRGPSSVTRRTILRTGSGCFVVEHMPLKEAKR